MNGIGVYECMQRCVDCQRKNRWLLVVDGSRYVDSRLLGHHHLDSNGWIQKKYYAWKDAF